MMRTLLLILLATAITIGGLAVANRAFGDGPGANDAFTVANMWRGGNEIVREQANFITNQDARDKDWSVYYCTVDSPTEGHCNAWWRSRTAACRGRVVMFMDEDESQSFYIRNQRCRARRGHKA